MPGTSPVIDRAMARLSYDHGCWRWGGALDPNGYGRISNRNGTQLVHRVVYQALVGPIPDGFVLDHLCRNPTCVNPDHMDVVTMRENVDRGRSKAKSHCKWGHEYTPANTLIRKDKRVCRECNRQWQNRYQMDKRAH